MIKIVWNIALPGSGKTLISSRQMQLLTDAGFNPRFQDDKIPLDMIAWSDIERFLHDPTRRTPEGGVRGEHSIVHNPDDGIGLFRIDFLDGNALNSAHENLFLFIEAFIRTSGDKEVLVLEWAPGVDDYSYGDDREPVIQNPQWLRDNILHRGLLQFSLIQEVIADEQIRVGRNNMREVHIPDDLFLRIFPDKGGRFNGYDRLIFGDRYKQLENNGNNKDELIQKVDEVFYSFVLPRLNGEGHLPPQARK